MGPGQSIPWGAWLVPLLAWGLFFGAAFTMMACLSIMLRAQWGDNEALAFPLLKLPLELTRGSENGAVPPFFRNASMWTGFGIAVFLQAINGLNLYFPEVPAIATSIDMAPYLSEAPWNQIGWVTLRIYPVAIGITFLLACEVSFSFWFFYWFLKFQLLGAYFLGFPPAALPRAPGGGPLFQNYQEVGANLTYAALIFGPDGAIWNTSRVARWAAKRPNPMRKPRLCRIRSRFGGFGAAFR